MMPRKSLAAVNPATTSSSHCAAKACSIELIGIPEAEPIENKSVDDCMARYDAKVSSDPQQKSD
jgi:hypothetical protein